jgi:tRNA-guanine family transglycosylase
MCRLIHSGGFQLVSLVALSKLTEEGVVMQSPFNAKETMTLSPEESMRIQHSIGADIMMQLDDVIVTTSPDKVRMEDAMWRSVRCEFFWSVSCLANVGWQGWTDV